MFGATPSQATKKLLASTVYILYIYNVYVLYFNFV